jgi:uncharacterized membrane protein YqaE (UPF0057 family)
VTATEGNSKSATRPARPRRKKTDPGMLRDALSILLSVLIPPAGVYLHRGMGSQFWINLGLTLAGYFPGLAHAIWLRTY